MQRRVQRGPSMDLKFGLVERFAAHLGPGLQNRQGGAALRLDGSIPSPLRGEIPPPERSALRSPSGPAPLPSLRTRAGPRGPRAGSSVRPRCARLELLCRPDVDEDGVAAAHAGRSARRGRSRPRRRLGTRARRARPPPAGRATPPRAARWRDAVANVLLKARRLGTECPISAFAKGPYLWLGRCLPRRRSTSSWQARARGRALGIGLMPVPRATGGAEV